MVQQAGHGRYGRDGITVLQNKGQCSKMTPITKYVEWKGHSRIAKDD